jgi:hypothetical protein
MVRDSTSSNWRICTVASAARRTVAYRGSAAQHDLFRREPHIRRPEDNRRQHECQERGADDDRLTRAIALGLPEKDNGQSAEEQIDQIVDRCKGKQDEDHYRGAHCQPSDNAAAGGRAASHRSKLEPTNPTERRRHPKRRRQQPAKRPEQHRGYVQRAEQRHQRGPIAVNNSEDRRPLSRIGMRVVKTSVKWLPMNPRRLIVWRVASDASVMRSPYRECRLRQPRLPSRSAQACSQRRQASAQMRQCSCMSAWASHSVAQLAQATRQASRMALVMLAS